MKKMIEFRYDTQLLIEGTNLDEDKITEYFMDNFICIEKIIITCSYSIGNIFHI